LNYIACFDIGGTYIKYGLIDSTGHLLQKNKIETPKGNVQKYLLEILCEKINELKKNFPISGIGISSCGLIDSEKGEILFSNNLKSYTGMKLAELLSNITTLPVRVENDVKSACLGEMWKGAIRGRENVVFLTLGTGIGSAIVINGNLVNGSTKLAGELGHTVIVHNGRSCSCGRKGCYERYASTSAFVQDYIEETKSKEVKKNISGEEIIQLAMKDDPAAFSVYSRFVHFISIGLANITHLLNPEAIIIGGGITEKADRLIIDINKDLKKEVMEYYEHDSLVLPSMLGNDAGLYGACYNMINKLNMVNKY
jgi:glucokinase